MSGPGPWEQFEMPCTTCDEEREHPMTTVCCDQKCGAPVAPVDLDGYRAATEHWRDHRYLSGCSHAR